MIIVAYYLYLVMTLIGVGAAALRLWRGPSQADRLNAADLISVSCIALLVASGAVRRDGIVMDVALATGLVLFFGTAMAVQLLRTPPAPTEEDKRDDR